MDVKELEFFKKTVNSNIIKASAGGVVLLGFIDEAKQKIIEMMVNKEQSCCVEFAGGFINPDYKRVKFYGYGIDDLNFKINVFQIIYSKKYLVPNHRMLLGTLMGLGIKRESIGDIYITDDYDIFFACTEEISPFLENNFKTLGKISIELKAVDYDITIVRKKEDKVKFLASMRLDVVLAGAYNLSRSEALDMITNGLVNVNHLPNLNPSGLLKEGDLLSVRHKGRVEVKSIGRNTKSNRIVVELSYYV